MLPQVPGCLGLALPAGIHCIVGFQLLCGMEHPGDLKLLCTKLGVSKLETAASLKSIPGVNSFYSSTGDACRDSTTVFYGRPFHSMQEWMVVRTLEAEARVFTSITGGMVRARRGWIRRKTDPACRLEFGNACPK